MKVLSYSPSVNVYVEAYNMNNKVYDLKNDITNVRVTRNNNTDSTFSVQLMNNNGKYNGVFTPMDKVVIYATKDKRYKLLTGYITTATAFSLYPNNFTLSGSCTLYRLQNLYVDLTTVRSFEAFSRGDGDLYNTGYAGMIYNLLTKVAGYSKDAVYISEVPEEVLETARNMYAAKQSDYELSDKLLKEFYEVLQSTSPQLSGGTGGDVQGYNGVASHEAVEAAVQWMERIAMDNSIGYSQPRRTMNPDVDCSSFVYYALKNNGWTESQLGGSYPFTTHNMKNILSKCGWRAYSYSGNPSELQRGDIMWRSGHTEMYIGGGKTVGAHSDYDGRPGDSSGREVSVVKIARNWTHYLRFTGV